MKRLAAAILSASVLLLSACGGETTEPVRNPGLPRSEPQVGTGYAQCDGRSGGGIDRSAEVMGTIQALAPNEDINCTDKHAFSFQKRTVYLVYLAFGTLSDCPAGCFSQDLCAIYDAPNVLLYEVSASTKPDRPGLSHGVVQTAEFRAFRDAQKRDGDWRFCFRDS